MILESRETVDSINEKNNRLRKLFLHMLVGEKIYNLTYGIWVCFRDYILELVLSSAFLEFLNFHPL